MGGPGFIQGVPDFDKLETVSVGRTTVSSDGSTTNWTTVPHNLNYRPIPLAFLDDVGLSGIFTDGDIPLPSFTSLSIDTTNHQIVMKTWLFATADRTNVYIILYNSLGTSISSLPVKYYLLRERTN